jgi:hypothetical protein
VFKFYSTHHHGDCARGKHGHKRPLLLAVARAMTAAAAAVSQASFPGQSALSQALQEQLHSAGENSTA